MKDEGTTANPIIRNHGNDSAGRGVTLIELLVSIVLISIIFLALGRIFTQYLKTFKSANKNLDVLIELRESMDRMSKEIRASMPMIDSGPVIHPEFRGIADKVRFNCIKSNANAGQSDIIELAYGINQYTTPSYDDYNHYCLQRHIVTQNDGTYALITDKMVQKDPLVDVSANLAYVMGVNITALAMQYGDNLGSMANTWEAGGDGTGGDAIGSKTYLPPLVRITLTATNDAGTTNEQMSILVRPYCPKIKRFN